MTLLACEMSASVGRLLNADVLDTLEGREEPYLGRETFYVKFFLSCHKTRILFHHL